MWTKIIYMYVCMYILLTLLGATFDIMPLWIVTYYLIVCVVSTMNKTLHFGKWKKDNFIVIWWQIKLDCIFYFCVFGARYKVIPLEQSFFRRRIPNYLLFYSSHLTDFIEWRNSTRFCFYIKCAYKENNKFQRNWKNIFAKIVENSFIEADRK